MKTISNIKIALVALLAVISLGFASCSDNDGGGQPEITGVRVCDPEFADSLFTKSSQGQTIAIIGRNLGDVVKVYINDQQVGFNPTENTDHSVIVAVPTETKGFQLTAFNSNLKDEIRVETTHGVATYAFKVLGASPSISRVQCAYPRKTGDILNVYGLNLYDIEELYFTDVTAAELAKTKWEEDAVPGKHYPAEYTTVKKDRKLNQNTQSYEVTSQLAVTIPELPFEVGALVVRCAAGIRYIAFSKMPGIPVIKSVSTEMPVLGETLVLVGNEFVQVESVSFGDVTYSASEMKVAESEDSIFIDITKLPSAATDNTVLTLKTVGGEATVDNYYDQSFMLCSFEPGTFRNQGWDPQCGLIENSPIGGTGTVAHFDSYGQWWGQMFFISTDGSNTPYVLPGYDKIPAKTPARDVYIAFEVYNAGSSYNNGGNGFQGFMRLNLWNAGNNADPGANPSYMHHNFEWFDYDAQTFVNPFGPVLQDINGEAPEGKWYRHVISLEELCGVAADGNNSSELPFQRGTYSDFYEEGLSIIRLMSYTQGTKSGNVNVYIDNLRIFYNKK